MYFSQVPLRPDISLPCIGCQQDQKQNQKHGQDYEQKQKQELEQKQKHNHEQEKEEKKEQKQDKKQEQTLPIMTRQVSEQGSCNYLAAQHDHFHSLSLFFLQSLILNKKIHVMRIYGTIFVSKLN